MAENPEIEDQPYRLIQEREFYKYIPLDHRASHFAPFDDASRSTFVAEPSRDFALTAYAQLGAIRLGAQRAMISLFDRTHQHVLAEATRTMGLRGDQVQEHDDRLRLGSCVLPKSQGLCQHVAKLPSTAPSDDDTVVDDSAFVVLDIKEHPRLSKTPVLEALSETRYYVGVPIRSPKGVTIGSYCVMDSQPRTQRPDDAALNFMKDMAFTIMDHLGMRRSKYRNRQAGRMVVGLGSFVEGRSTLRDSWNEARRQQHETDVSGETTEGQLNKHQQDIQEEEVRASRSTISRRDFAQPPNSTSQPQPSSTIKETEMPTAEETNGEAKPTSSEVGELPLRPGTALQNNQPAHPGRQTISGAPPRDDDLHSTAINQVFSRAANLIRESIEAEGVVFLDATGESFGGLVGSYSSRRVSEDTSRESTSSSEDSPDSPSPARSRSPPGQAGEDGPPLCKALGFATTKFSSINNQLMNDNHLAVRESVLKTLMNRYPRGKIFNYNENRSISDDGSDGSTSRSPLARFDTPDSSGSDQPSRRKKQKKPSVNQDAEYLIQIFPDARSICLVPIPDSPKARCFAAGLVWTNAPERIFTSEHELTYISAFGNSIMAEIHRLDFEMSEKAKTNLVSSISHELRNPLHGILGTADILSDTAMNALQHGMVHTIESCGRTLLDTINHLLDFTSVRKFKKGSRKDSRRLQNQNREQGGDPTRLIKSSGGEEKKPIFNVQLDAILEEVIESVFAGYSFYTHPRARPQALDSTNEGKLSVQLDPPLGPVTVIFDIQGARQWSFLTQPGAWRRILMNLFGNALKYTESGFIYLSLHSSPKSTDTKSEKSPDRRASQGHATEFEVALTVRDTGKGIGSNYLQKDLFKPFSQENALASGSGLGLSIVRQAVSSLNGSIEVSSTQGEGTELSITTTLTHQPVATQSDDPSSEEIFGTLRRSTRGKTLGLIGFGPDLSTPRDKTLHSALERLCRDWFQLETRRVSPLKPEENPLDFYLVIKTDMDHPDEEARQLANIDKHLIEEQKCTSPIVVLCPSPEHAHNMFAAAKSRNKSTIFEFISQPCGPRKLAKALDLCMKRQTNDGDTQEPTRWVELPESSHLPLDIGPSDPPNERMKISKRPTTETLQSPDRRPAHGAGQESQREISPTTEADPSAQAETLSQNKTAVLLVDDNPLNLQLLVALTKKEKYDHMTARDGSQAVEVYKANVGRVGACVIDLSMPVMDGFEAARQIRRFEKEYVKKLDESLKPSFKPTFIAAVTGLDSADAQQEAYGSGIDTFLIKPVKRPDLRSVLSKMMGQDSDQQNSEKEIK